MPVRRATTPTGMLNAESYVRTTSLIRAELQSDVARNVAILAGQPIDGCVIVMGEVRRTFWVTDGGPRAFDLELERSTAVHCTWFVRLWALCRAHIAVCRSPYLSKCFNCSFKVLCNAFFLEVTSFKS